MKDICAQRIGVWKKWKNGLYRENEVNFSVSFFGNKRWQIVFCVFRRCFSFLFSSHFWDRRWYDGEIHLSLRKMSYVCVSLRENLVPHCGSVWVVVFEKNGRRREHIQRDKKKKGKKCIKYFLKLMIGSPNAAKCNSREWHYLPDKSEKIKSSTVHFFNFLT